MLIEQTAVGAGSGAYGVNLRVNEGAGQTDIVCNLSASATVGIAAQSGATAADDGDATSLSVNGGTVRMGAHEIPTITTDLGAVVYNESNITTLNQNTGTFYSNAGTIGTATVINGTFVGNGTGTITTLSVKEAGIADFSQDLRSKTVTNAVQLYGRATLKDPNGVVTFSGAVKLNDTNLDDITLDLAKDKTWTLT